MSACLNTEADKASPYPHDKCPYIETTLRRKICVVTSNRSDWSKLKLVAINLRKLFTSQDKGSDIQVDIICLGSHLLHELGATKNIVKEDFPNAYELHTLVAGDSVESMTDSVGFGIVKLTSLLCALKPNIVLVHGDRFDAFCAAIAANMLNLTIAHIEGGELSGTVDGTLRHAITKLSHLHFTCTPEAARRIRGMGENPASIFVTGCPSYDSLFAVSATCWEDEKMDEFFNGTPFKVKPNKFILVIMHPVTNDFEESNTLYNSLLSCLFSRKSPTVMFYPNVDPGNKSMIQTLHKHQKADPASTSWLRLVTHMPHAKFTALMRHASAMVGNSSAGIRESCVFGIPTLNLGSRQEGRRVPSNVTTLVKPSIRSIDCWFENELGKRYAQSTMYGFPDSAKRIAHHLSRIDTSAGQLKQFWEPRYALLPPLQPRQYVSRAQAILADSTSSPIGRCKILGLITARGGSKGIPGKNIIDLNGKPLIQYTIEAALSSKQLDRVILSTDSDEIAEVAQNCGCEVPFRRPSELAADDSSHLACIVHALNILRETECFVPDFVVILQPTSPFRKSIDIDTCINIMLTSSCDMVLSVCESSLNLSKNFYFAADGTLSPFAESTAEIDYTPRQKLLKTYAENGAVYVLRTQSLLCPPDNAPNVGSFRSADTKGYEMPVERSLDIDNPFDLHVARLLMAKPF
mmetsp:Transcript_13581/g.59282  ORF Transcript_13581/g.59282 Transcript_13581/m.59282 type:complete len:691 (-) Transcript_13581:397-2469(-)